MTTRQPGKTGEMKNQGPLGSHCTDQMRGPERGFDPAAGLGLFRDSETKREGRLTRLGRLRIGTVDRIGTMLDSVGDGTSTHTAHSFTFLAHARFLRS